MKASKEEKKLIILSRKNTFLGGLGL